MPGLQVDDGQPALFRETGQIKTLGREIHRQNPCVVSFVSVALIAIQVHQSEEALAVAANGQPALFGTEGGLRAGRLELMHHSAGNAGNKATAHHHPTTARSQMKPALAGELEKHLTAATAPHLESASAQQEVPGPE